MAEQLHPEDIYQTLEYEIVTLKIKPGETISENQLCKRFGISRTPVRAALQRLEQNMPGRHGFAGDKGFRVGGVPGLTVGFADFWRRNFLLDHLIDPGVIVLTVQPQAGRFLQQQLAQANEMLRVLRRPAPVQRQGKVVSLPGAGRSHSAAE